MLLLQCVILLLQEVTQVLRMITHYNLLVKVLLFVMLCPQPVESANFENLTGLLEETMVEETINLLADINGTDSTPNETLSITFPGFTGGIIVNEAGENIDIDATYMLTKRNKTAEDIVRRSLRGTTLKVVAMVEPPYVNYLNISDEAQEFYGYGPGIVMEILKDIGRPDRLDLQYEFFSPPDGLWGEYNKTSKSWNGAVGVLARGEADILAGAMIVRFDRYAVLDFSYPFMASETGMLIRAPDQYIDNTFLIVARPFSRMVWVMIAVSIVVSGLVMKALTYSLRNANEVQYTWFGSAWVFFSVFVQQGLPIQPKSWTCRSLLALWWLAALTLVATFTGNMVALFAVEKSILPLNSLDEMVDKVENGYSIILNGRSSTRQRFIEMSELDLFKRLRKQMEAGRVRYVGSMESAGVELVKSEPKMILLGPKDSLEVFAARDCKVTVTDGTLIPVWFSIPVKKNSPYTIFFSDAIRKLVETGFIVKWTRDYQFHLATEAGNKRCIYKQGISTRGNPIDILRAQGAFWIVVGGVLLGLGGMLWEYFRRLTLYVKHKTGISLCWNISPPFKMSRAIHITAPNPSAFRKSTLANSLEGHYRHNYINGWVAAIHPTLAPVVSSEEWTAVRNEVARQNSLDHGLQQDNSEDVRLRHRGTQPS